MNPQHQIQNVDTRHQSKYESMTSNSKYEPLTSNQRNESSTSYSIYESLYQIKKYGTSTSNSNSNEDLSFLLIIWITNMSYESVDYNWEKKILLSINGSQGTKD